MISATKTLEAQRVHSEYTAAWALVLVFVDLVMFLTAALMAAAAVKHDLEVAHLLAFFFSSSYIFVVFWIALFHRLGLYRQTLALSVRDEFYYIVAALSIGIVPQLFVFTIVQSLSSSRLILILSALVAVVLVGGSRAAMHALRDALAARSPRRLGVVGEGPAVDALVSAFDLNPGESFVRVAGPVALDGDEHAALATLTAALETARAAGCDTLVAAEIPPPGAIPEIAENAARNHVRMVFAVPGLQFQSYGLRLGRSGRQALIEPLRLRACSPVGRLLKRLFDLCLAFPILVLAAPVMSAAAVLIWLESGAPVFYRQERVGRGGAIFDVLKFRTMRKESQGRSWATRNDPRITKIGAFLRRTSIDELPQLFNVLKGDMSIVGPRPEMKCWAQEFTLTLPRYAERHLVRPGITGWSQIYMKRLLEPIDAPDVLQHDLFYIEHWGLLMDLSIVCKTAVEFLFHRPA